MLSTSITSLTFIRNDSILVVANGSFVCFNNTHSGTLVSSFKAFEKETVSLIVSSTPNILLVAGNTQLQVWEINDDLNSGSFKRVDRFEPKSFCSRILDCKLMEDTKECDTAIAIAFAHNFVEIVDYSTKRALLRVVCEDRCFLYSAKLFGNSWSSLVMAAGTVWSGVHIWDIFSKEESTDLESSIHYGRVINRFAGHEGSVFDLNFNNDGTMLASCSDDRSIRVWNVRDSSMEPIVFYGHESRVWRAVFKNNLIYSVSEVIYYI
jgi:WD40 repeat protein